MQTLLVLRVVAATVIAVFAIGKLARLPESADDMWRPAIVGPRLALWLLIVWSLLELGVVLLVLLAPEPIGLTAGVIAVFFVAVTTYGTWSIRRSGQCGCAGGLAETKPARLWLRNLTMLGTCLAGVLFGPTVTELSTVQPYVFLVLSLLPLAILALAVIRRSGRLRYIA